MTSGSCVGGTPAWEERSRSERREGRARGSGDAQREEGGVPVSSREISAFLVTLGVNRAPARWRPS